MLQFLAVHAHVHLIGQNGIADNRGEAVSRCRKAEKPRRIIDEDFGAGSFVWRDHGQQIQQIAFIGRATGGESIAMWPIAAPKHPIRRDRNDLLSKGDHIHEG